MPTAQEYAKMAIAVYKPEGGDPPVGWELSEYAKPPNRWGFCVAIYRNTVKKEIVISFKGTNEWIQQIGNAGLAAGHVPPQLGDAEAKVREVLDTYASSPPSSILSESAEEILPSDFYYRLIITITKAIIALLQGDFSTFRSLISEFLNSEAKDVQNNFDKISYKLAGALEKIQNENPNYKICITGHSLGACIAELCAARFNLEATTFDSPGSKELISADPRYQQPNYSKITSYLAAPNIVNTLYGHVGTCYRVFIPYVEEDWTWKHAGACVAAESVRFFGYGLTLLSGGVAAPVMVGIAGIIGGVSAASIFGLLPNSDDFRRQHSIDNIHTAITRAERLPVLMFSWPKFSEIRWASLYTGLRALAPLPADSPSIRVMLDQNSMIEEQIKNLDGYKESTEQSPGAGNNPSAFHANNNMSKGADRGKTPPEMKIGLATRETNKLSSSKLEEEGSNYFKKVFGSVKAEEDSQFTSTHSLFTYNSERINLLPTNQDNKFSVFGISSMVVGFGGILYSKYHYHQKAKKKTSYTDIPIAPTVNPSHDVINSNNHSSNFSQYPASFFSRQVSLPITSARLSNLASKGRAGAGIFAITTFTTFYRNWQMIKQNKQVKIHGNIERGESITPSMRKGS